MESRLRPLGFKEFFTKQQLSGSYQNEMNRKSKKIQSKNRWDFKNLYVCECVSVCGCECVWLYTLPFSIMEVRVV